MAVNNLRVIYQNLADLTTTTITASNTKNTALSTITGSISGYILTTSAGTPQIGMYLSGSTIPTNTYIVSGTGTSWTLNQSLTVASTTIIGTLTSTPSANLQKDAKSLVWRSSNNSATLTVSFGSLKTIRGVVLPFTNLTALATATIAPTGGSGTTPLTGVLVCPYAQTDSWDASYLPIGANSYAYGSGTYARAWFPTAQTCTGLTIELTDNSNTAGYIEASRLIVGDYWSPQYNTTFGLTSAPKSLSSTMRTESGDLITNRGIQYNSMSFDLAWLTPTDRQIFTKILKSNGINKPLLISLFPDASEDYNKEQTFQIYGKLSQLSDITHPMYTMYSSKIEIEEI